MRFLPFEDHDPSLLPMSARRALDLAGLKLSLRAWQALSLPVRETLARLGEEAEVDGEVVLELVDAADPAPAKIDPVPDPDRERVPDAVRAALGDDRAITDKQWRALSVVARYALASYARRGRDEKLTAAYDALFSRG